MITLSIKKLSEIVDGQLIGIEDEQRLIHQVSIDSRNIEMNSLFIALQGKRFDGHEFIDDAIKLGAIAALVNQKKANDLPQIIVEDTHRALGIIAAWVRSKSKAKVVALTGSSGKTSVKEMTASILSFCGQTCFTQGNFNNDIGVPLTLLRLTEHDQFAVIELGANHIGEIAYTSSLVKPQTALINNIASAHLEGFGSLEGVAKAKSEIFLGLADGETAIVNLDSYCKKWLEDLMDKSLVTFSLQKHTADFYAKAIRQGEVTQFVLCTPYGEVDIQLSLLGRHNVINAVAASALAMSVGANLAQVKKGLSLVKPVKGRLYPIRLNQQQLILDDAYNANLSSMMAAIEVLAEQKGYRILVVGDMAELGESSSISHQQVGEAAKQAKIDCVVSVGNDSALISQFSGVGHHFDTKHDAVEFLKIELATHHQATLLVKGSRSAKMEEIIYHLNHNQD